MGKEGRTESAPACGEGGVCCGGATVWLPTSIFGLFVCAAFVRPWHRIVFFQASACMHATEGLPAARPKQVKTCLGNLLTPKISRRSCCRQLSRGAARRDDHFHRSLLLERWCLFQFDVFAKYWRSLSS